jgi:hypothetical protein
MAIDYRVALDAFERAYGGISDLAAGLSRADLLAFSRCHGWVVADVLFHLLCDAQRALVALASPAPGPPDRDFVSYWTGFVTEADDSAPGAWRVRRSAAAFLDGTGVVALWQETAPAAVRAAGSAVPDGHITTQGHVLAVPDFLTTLVTEAVIHHLDMTVELRSAPSPGPQAIAKLIRPVPDCATHGPNGFEFSPPGHHPPIPCPLTPGRRDPRPGQPAPEVARPQL